MSKKKERRKREERRLHAAKATVGAVLEQCSTPELAVIIRFLERQDYDALLKIGILASASCDIRAARRAEDAATKKATRKLARAQEREFVGVAEEAADVVREDVGVELNTVPRMPVPDSDSS